MLATLALLLVSFVPASQVKTDMFPSGQTRRLELQFELNGVYTLDEMERAVEPLERWLYERREELEIAVGLRAG